MAADCGSTCPVEGGFYSYNPNVVAPGLLLAIYCVTLPTAVCTGARFRTPIFSATLTTAVLLEALGLIGRILLHGNQDSQTYFTLSLLGTLLGPAFMSLAIFLVLPHTLIVYGEHLSPLRPMFAGFVLYTVCIVGVILQLVGLVFAAYGTKSVTWTTSVNIVAGGLGLQIASLVTFVALHAYVTLGLSSSGNDMDTKHATVYQAPRFTRFLRALEVATFLLLGYSVYRIVEMVDGIDGSLFQNEIAFMVVCGAVPLVACVLLTTFTPGFAFGSAWNSTSPRRSRRAAPLQIQHHPAGYNMHHRYDPHIRKQISPTTPKHRRLSSLPGGGSPGLPPNPKPSSKPTSPLMPRPPSRTSQTTETRYTDRPLERRSYVPKKDMVEPDALW